MSVSRPSQTKPRAKQSDNGNQQGEITTPYDTVVTQVVAKIKNEPFLFVLGLAALIIGLVVVATKLGSSDLRFVIVTIALLAFVVILGYYSLSGYNIYVDLLRERRRTQPLSDQQPDKDKSDATPTSPLAAPITTIATASQQASTSVSSGPANMQPQTQLNTALPGDPAALQRLLALHQRNLERLLEQKAVYAAGEEPLRLLSQIDAEEQQIREIGAAIHRNVNG